MKNRPILSLHEELIHTLHEQLDASDRVIIANVGVGSRMWEGSIPVPDLMMFRKSYTKPDITIFEIKASKQDYAADVREGKYRRYFDISNRVYFACVAGMLKKDELPQGTGLYTYNEEKKSWSAVKFAPRRECELDRIQWMSLMFSLRENQAHFRALRERINAEENILLEDIARNLPQRFSDTIRNHREAVGELENYRKELAEKLGLEGRCSWWDIRNAIDALKKDSYRSDRKLVELGMSVLKDAIDVDGIHGWSLDERMKQLEEYMARLKALKEKNSQTP